jgi:hypothetical protein
LLTNIKSGRFERLWLDFAQRIGMVDLSDINLRVPLYLEKDSALYEKRQKFCKVKNDMLERLADYEPQQSISSLHRLPGVLTDNRFARLTWNRMLDN